MSWVTNRTVFLVAAWTRAISACSASRVIGSTAAKGSAEPGYDNSTVEGRAKNRRALIVVTLVSGS